MKTDDKLKTPVREVWNLKKAAGKKTRCFEPDLIILSNCISVSIIVMYVAEICVTLLDAEFEILLNLLFV